MSAFTAVARLDDLWSGEMRGCVVNGARVLLVRLDDEVFAFHDRCAHMGVPLSDGALQDGVITCGAHHWQYDARSGCGINPQGARLCPLQVELRDGEVRVALLPERRHVA